MVKRFVLLVILSLLVGMLPAFAQDTTNPALDGFSRDEIMSAVWMCDALSRDNDGSYVDLNIAIPVDSGTELPCEAVVGYGASKYVEPQIADYSWALPVSTFHLLGGQANVRVAPDANARLLGGVTPTTSPVVEVLAVYAVSDTETRVLVRSKELTGWVNNADAKLDLAVPLDKPADWTVDVMPDALNNIAGGEPAGWSAPTLFTPNGDPVTDVSRTETDLFGHGRLLHGTDIHFAFPIRENRKYNPAVVLNGLYMRVEGDLWRYFPNWQIGWPTGAPVPGAEKLPITGEFLVKDAFEHYNIDFTPSAYVYVGMAGSALLFRQDEILVWPQANTVLEQAVCPSAPVRLNVAGDYNGNVMNYDAAVGNSKCPSFLIGVLESSAADTFEIMALEPGVQAQEVYYLRDQTTFIMVPDQIDSVDLMLWVSANLSNIQNDLGIADRTNVNMTGVPGMVDGVVPVSSLLAG